MDAEWNDLAKEKAISWAKKWKMPSHLVRSIGNSESRKHAIGIIENWQSELRSTL